MTDAVGFGATCESERRSWVVGLCSPGHVELSHGLARKSSQSCRLGMDWNVLERLGTFSPYGPYIAICFAQFLWVG